MSTDRSSEDDSCDAVVMAAMEAIGEHCGDERVPIEAEDGLVVMAPKDGIQRVRSQASPEMGDREVKSMMNDADWLSDWTESVCEAAGHRAGSSDCEDCQIRFARKILSPR